MSSVDVPVSFFAAESQEDRVVAIQDLNVHIPEENRSELDPSRSFFAVFDGRELC